MDFGCIKNLNPLTVFCTKYFVLNLKIVQIINFQMIVFYNIFCVLHRFNYNGGEGGYFFSIFIIFIPFLRTYLSKLAVGCLILYRHWFILFIVEISRGSLVLLLGFWRRLVDHDVTDPGDRFAATVDSHMTVLASVHNPKK